MRPSPISPAALITVAAFLVGLFLLFVVLPVSVVASSFEKLGMTPMTGILLVASMLVAARVNVPVYTFQRLVRVFPGPRLERIGPFTLLSWRGQEADPDEPMGGELKRQRLAVNLGGCVLPLAVGGYLVRQLPPNTPLWPLGVSALAVAVGAFLLARPRPGVGVAVPMWVPPLLAAFAAVLFAPPEIRPQAAWIGGTVGTLVGADVGHMISRRSWFALDAEVLAVGGSGTFGAILLSNILSVFLS